MLKKYILASLLCTAQLSVFALKTPPTTTEGIVLQVQTQLDKLDPGSLDALFLHGGLAGLQQAGISSASLSAVLAQAENRAQAFRAKMKEEGELQKLIDSTNTFETYMRQMEAELHKLYSKDNPPSAYQIFRAAGDKAVLMFIRNLVRPRPPQRKKPRRPARERRRKDKETLPISTVQPMQHISIKQEVKDERLDYALALIKVSHSMLVDAYERKGIPLQRLSPQLPVLQDPWAGTASDIPLTQDHYRKLMIGSTFIEPEDVRIALQDPGLKLSYSIHEPTAAKVTPLIEPPAHSEYGAPAGSAQDEDSEKKFNKLWLVPVAAAIVGGGYVAWKKYDERRSRFNRNEMDAKILQMIQLMKKIDAGTMVAKDFEVAKEKILKGGSKKDKRVIISRAFAQYETSRAKTVGK